MRVKHNIVAYILLLSWISQLVYLFPVPDEKLSNSINAITEDVVKERAWIAKELGGGEGNSEVSISSDDIWNAWFHDLFLVMVGVATAFLGIGNYKNWSVISLIPAIYYLAIWYTRGSTHSVSLLKAFELKWLTAQTLGMESVFFHKDVVLPLVFVFLFYGTPLISMYGTVIREAAGVMCAT